MTKQQLLEEAKKDWKKNPNLRALVKKWYRPTLSHADLGRIAGVTKARVSVLVQELVHNRKKYVAIMGAKRGKKGG